MHGSGRHQIGTNREGLPLCSSKSSKAHSFGLCQRQLVLLSESGGDGEHRRATASQRSPAPAPKRSRSMHGESLRRITISQGCRYKSDVSCAFQASPKPNITAGQSIIAWTLPALRLAGRVPTPQNRRPSGNDSFRARPRYNTASIHPLETQTR